MVTRTKKIFVGGLSAPTTLEDVKNYFEQFGPVSVRQTSLFLLFFQRMSLPEASESSVGLFFCFLGGPVLKLDVAVFEQIL